ncbi:hypothetical protein BGX28_008081 [Mortierella sp. GBA30]|nr:hypothetical protein BGX28_008081 [Mortierella sp. GBA30]
MQDSSKEHGHNNDLSGADALEPVESSQGSQVGSAEDRVTSKRTLPEEEPESNDVATTQTSQPSQSQDLAAGSESPQSSNKRRRISFPGRSILKTASQDEERDQIGSRDITEDQIGSGNALAADVTDSFSSTAEFRKRNRKSIGRRVSFATTARIRMFDRDEKENEFPKTTSFLEGLKGQVSLNTPFTFRSNDDNIDNSQDTLGSMSSVDMDTQSQEQPERTETSVGSSDSEKERSFEVDIDSGTSDNTAGSSVFPNSSDQSHDGAPFDNGEVDHGSSSEEDSNYFPDINPENRPSSAAMLQDERDGVLGPQVYPGPPITADHLQQSQDAEDETQDMSMASEDFSMSFSYQNFSSAFMKARSSLPGENQNRAEGLTGSQDHISDVQVGAIASHNSDIADLVDNHLVSDHLGIASLLDHDMMDDIGKSDKFNGDGDTTDMDITAPIGVGIHEIAQEQPPTAFLDADENTARFSETGAPMDLTTPIGSGIRDIAQEQQPAGFSQTDDSTGLFSDFGTPMDMTQPIGAGILETRSSQERVAIEEDDASNMHSIPSTPTKQLGNNDSNHNDNANDTINNSHNGSNTSNGNSRRDSVANAERPQSPQQQIPSTPPRRESAIRADSSSPILIPRRSLGAPGRFTPTVKARLNIFPEVLERQLRTLEASSSTAPVFRASHVSPETSNLAKRIYRYSAGAPSRSSEQFQARLQEEREDTMDMSMGMEIEESQSSLQDSAKDITTDIPALADNNEQPRRTSKSQETTSREHSPEGTSASEGDDSAEMQPISLSKFLSLVGISFLDHLNASTRRRTVPNNESDSSTEACRREDFVKAKAIYMQELESYRDACGLLKDSTESSRAFSADQERKVLKKNPQYFIEYRDSDLESKEFMKERLKLIKVHSKLVTNADFTSWKSEVLERQQESLEHHLGKLKEDIAHLQHIGSGLAREKAKAMPRSEELRRLKEDADERHRSYEQCDKEQLAHLAEAVEEQGAQIDHYNLVREKKERELAEMRARVEQLKLTEQTTKRRIAEAEKTIQEYQFVRPDDLKKAKDLLSIIQATHRWETVKRIPSLSSASEGNGILEFIYDKTLRVSIDRAKVGRGTNAMVVSEFEEDEPVMDLDLSLKDRKQSLPTISALMSKKRKSIKEYVGLLRDYTTLIAAKYKTGTTISKILQDISQFWCKICLIRNEIELVRAHHIVDLVAGSEENVKELENNDQSKQRQQQQLVAGSTPIVLLDIRVRFTGPMTGLPRSGRHNSENGDADDHDSNGDGGDSGPAGPVKFYLWFTFTLNDLLSFPGPDSFAWRIEFVYGDMRQDLITQAVGPTVKKGGYGVLRDICAKVNQLLRM